MENYNCQCKWKNLEAPFAKVLKEFGENIFRKSRSTIDTKVFVWPRNDRISRYRQIEHFINRLLRQRLNNQLIKKCINISTFWGYEMFDCFFNRLRLAPSKLKKTYFSKNNFIFPILYKQIIKLRIPVYTWFPLVLNPGNPTTPGLIGNVVDFIEILGLTFHRHFLVRIMYLLPNLEINAAVHLQGYEDIFDFLK